MTKETNFFITSDGTAIIVHKNALKEHALKIASEWFKIPLSNIIVFGDDVNDIEMLKMAGIGIAMGNAVPAVRAIADYVTGSNDEDGISIWINNYLLTDESFT